jgi:hypothetical protein
MGISSFCDGAIPPLISQFPPEKESGGLVGAPVAPRMLRDGKKSGLAASRAVFTNRSNYSSTLIA